MTSGARVAVVHTVQAVRDDLDARFRAAGLPEVQHLVDPSLLDDLLAGRDPDDVERQLGEHLDAFGDDVDVVAVSCSSLTPGVQRLRVGRATPIVTIDEQLAERAVQSNRVGVLCTSRATVAGTTALLERAAATAERTIALEVRFVEGAYDALRAGDRPRHDQLVGAAASALAPHVDVLVLAQASLARLESELAEATGRTVLSPPPSLIAELQRILA